MGEKKYYVVNSAAESMELFLMKPHLTAACDEVGYPCVMILTPGEHNKSGKFAAIKAIGCKK